MTWRKLCSSLSLSSSHSSSYKAFPYLHPLAFHSVSWTAPWTLGSAGYTAGRLTSLAVVVVATN